MKENCRLKDNNTATIVESSEMFNKWSKLESSDGSRILATSQFFYPLDVRVYIDAIRERTSSLIATEIWPVGFCNHRCSFCSSSKYNLLQKGRLLSVQLLKKVIKDLSKIGNKLVRFSGGANHFCWMGWKKLLNMLGKLI